MNFGLMNEKNHASSGWRLTEISGGLGFRGFPKAAGAWSGVVESRSVGVLETLTVEFVGEAKD